MLLNNQWVSQEIKEKIKNTVKQMKTKIRVQTGGMQQKQFKQRSLLPSRPKLNSGNKKNLK